MKSKINFGSWEIITVIINLICMQILLSFPRIMAASAGTAGWIFTLYISVLAFISFIIISRLYKRFEMMDLMDLGEYLGGATIRILVGLTYFVHAMFSLVLSLREFSEHMKTVALPQTPISFVILCFSIGIIAANYIGLETILRLHAIIVPIIIAGFILIIIGASSCYHIYNILPIMGNGNSMILVQGLSRLSSFSGIIGIFLFFPYMGNYNTFKKSGFSGIVISAVLLILSSLTYQLLYEYPGSTQSFLPLYSMAKTINIGRFFQHLEASFLFIWAASGLLYLSTVLYFSTYYFKKAFKLKYTKPLIVPMMVISFTLCLLPNSLMSTLNLEANILRTYSWIIYPVVPILLLIASGIKKKKKKSKGCGVE